MPGRPISPAQLIRLRGEFEPAGDQVDGSRLRDGSVVPSKLSQSYATAVALAALAQQVAHNAIDQDAVNEGASASLASEVAARAAAIAAEAAARAAADSALGLLIAALPSDADVSAAIDAVLPETFSAPFDLSFTDSGGHAVVMTLSRRGIVTGVTIDGTPVV